MPPRPGTMDPTKAMVMAVEGRTGLAVHPGEYDPALLRAVKARDAAAAKAKR